jgi:glucose/arabinose dehydrogenase
VEPRKARGYEVIFIPMRDCHASDEYGDVLTGFATKDGGVWGRPVGVAVGNDGSLFVTDDGSRSVWRVTWVANSSAWALSYLQLHFGQA